MPKTIILSICSVFIIMTGCARQPGLAKDRICVDKISPQAAIHTAEKVLTHMHFDVEKADPNAGTIITEPLAGAQFFELWRKDNQDQRAAILANLHTIRRTATLELNKSRTGVCIECDVRVERLSLSESDKTRKFESFSWFSSDRAIDRLKLDDEQRTSMAWIDLGTDKQLATEILRRVETQFSGEQK